MNIDNSIGMALFTNDISAASASGSFNGLASGQTEGTEGSLFQRLISQMMAKNQMTAAAVVNGNSTPEDKSGETGNLLSELLLAGGNTARVQILNMDIETDESTQAGVPAAEQVATEENSVASEEIQAFMAGFSNMVQTANAEQNLSDTQPVNAAAQGQTSEISALQQSGNILEAPINQSGKSIQDHAALASGERPEVIKVATKEKTVLNEESTVMQPKEMARIQATEIGSSSGTKEMDKSNAVKTGQNGKSENPNGISGLDFKATESASNRQTASAGIQMKETAAESTGRADIAGAAEKTKPETETKGISLERAGFQNLMQGAAAARETAETVPPSQTVESSQPYSQIKAEILTKLEQNGPTEFKMQLDPEDLGQIDIKLKLSEGKLIIDILAANSRTQALLTGQADKLIASMGLQNVTVESIQVSQQMNSQTSDSGQGQGYTMNAAMDFSQRKQQEQYQQQVLNDSKLTGALNRQPDEAQTNSQANRIGATRYDSHRINYAV